MITSVGVQLHRWYQMGITDGDDLLWLLEFYNIGGQGWNRSLVLASLTRAIRYYESR